MKKEAEYVYNELRNYGTVLDVGCGIGSFEQSLPSLNITGLHISEEMLEETRKRSDKTFIQGNATDLELARASSGEVASLAFCGHIRANNHSISLGEGGTMVALYGLYLGCSQIIYRGLDD